ncbi:SDR family oxidoreductase [Inhella gelatinilytica]|uniref:SDR family oxidoreductase n=1 Tax=Inhella gelatinilytica TaxID=2795030 RepID=A0A931IUJ0_9BURK|nr:SDR family oxidoreductase [Inhella gelatinilytica]MBH9551249.1 SDR family oxidoreductase [Inhella gelatinilytica]
MRPTVLITGAARRLGRHLALHLARQGYDVAAHHRAAPDADADSLSAELAALGARAVALPADLEDEAAVERLVPAAVEALGHLDAVVNSASLFSHDDIATLSYANLERHLRANTAAALTLARALHRHCETARHAGCVVNVLDQKLWNPNPDHLSYTLSKAALEAATPVLAQALAPRVRVVGVALGVTLPSGPMTEAEFLAAHALTPLGRSSTPDDFAQAVHYLLGAKAVTGTTLLVDGGQHLAAQPRDVYYLVKRD